MKRRSTSSFALSTLAVFVALSISSSHSIAQSGGIPECTFTTGTPIYANPHCVINYTSDIANKYNGEGVKLGLVDEGFILSHDSLNIPNIQPLTFNLHNPIAGREDKFDPNVDFKEQDSDGDVSWATHGGATSGAIVAKARSYPRPEYSYDYEGGIAKNATLYVASALPTDRSGNDKATTYSELNIFTSKPAGSFYDYYLARYAGGINRVLEEKPLAINLSINITPDFKTAEEADAKYRSAIAQHENSPFIQAVKKSADQDTLLVFATGNEFNPQPGIFTLLPRYINGLDKHLIAATALPLPVDPAQLPIADMPNKCGVAKNWCITAPGAFLALTMRGAEQDQKIPRTVEEFGTSFAAPVVTGSLALLKQRFNYFKPSQVRDTLFTTATDIGDKGVDEVYGWGLVNIENAIKGPAQLLDNETYTVTEDDRWDNALNANGYTFTKKGANRLTLTGDNQLAQVEVREGTLAFEGQSRSTGIENRARLEIGNTLRDSINGSLTSETVIKSGGHWIMPSNSRLGSVTFEQGGQITLNPDNAQAGGKVSETTKFNTLIIDQQLSGHGIFNFLTRIQDWVGDTVLVNGIATGDFQLNVQNSGAEPSSSNRLTLLALRHGAQDEYAVNVKLVNPVDLGAYRYELVKTEKNEYRLYNPRKEQELILAEEEEARRRQAEEEQARQAEAEKLAEAQRLAQEREQALNVEKLLRETTEKELETARRVQASQAEALSRADENLAELTRLNEAIQAQLTAEQTDKALALQASQALQEALEAQQAATNSALIAKEKAEQAQMSAEGSRDEALQQAQQALVEAEAKAELARQASERAIQAEQAKQQAQADLDNLTLQLIAQRSATALAKEAQQVAEQALAKQTEALQAQQQAREEAERASQIANTEKADALKNAEQAQQIANQKIAEATLAHQQVAEITAQLTELQEEAERTRLAQRNAENARLEAETARIEAERLQRLAEEKNATLLNNQNTMQADLQHVRQTLELTQQQLDAQRQEAERVNQARLQAEADKAKAELLVQQSEQEKARAQEAQTLAEQAMQEALSAKAKAEADVQAALNAKVQAEAEAQQAQTAQANAEQLKQQAEQQLNNLQLATQQTEQRLQETLQAKQAVEEALAEERIAREQLEQLSAILGNTQDQNVAALVEANLQLSQANSLLAEKEKALATARLAEQTAQAKQREAELAMRSVEVVLRATQTQLADALVVQQQAEENALKATLLEAQAQADKLLAQQAEADVQARLLQALAEQARAQAEQANAQAQAEQANLQLAQAEADLAKINEVNQALNRANAELAQALSTEQQATALAENAQKALLSAQQQAELARNQAQSSLANAERLLAEKVQESEKATQQLNLARQAQAQAEADKAVAEEQARLAQLAQVQAEADKAAAEEQARLAQLAQVQAEADKAVAEEQARLAQLAQAEAEADKAATEEQARLAQLAQAQAEAEKAVAEADKSVAQAQAEQALAVAEQAKQDADNALAEATQALVDKDSVEQALQAANIEAENANHALQAEYARQAQQEAERVQAELISRYANSALSELSSQVNVLEQIGYSLNQHLRIQPQSLSVWTEHQQQELNQASENYRRYQQKSQLTQLGVNIPLAVEGVNVGMVLSDVRATADFDDNAQHKNRTKFVSSIAQLRLSERAIAYVDLGVGNSHNRIRLEGENVEFSRSLLSAGLGIGYTAEALGLNIRPNVGMRYHRLGPVSYELGQAQIDSKELDLIGLQAGLEIAKSWKLGGLSLSPYFASYYSDMSQQLRDIEVNDQVLAQQFGKRFRHEIGLNSDYANWQIIAKLGVISGNEASTQRYAGVKLNYQW